MDERQPLLRPLEEATTARLRPLEEATTARLRPLKEATTARLRPLEEGTTAQRSHTAEDALVAFDPDGDTDNPRDWPASYRWGITTILAFMAFTV